MAEHPADVYVSWCGFMRDDRPGRMVTVSKRDQNIDLNLGSSLYISISQAQAARLRDELTLALDDAAQQTAPPRAGAALPDPSPAAVESSEAGR